MFNTVLVQETYVMNTHDLGNGLQFIVRQLPDDLVWAPTLFKGIWELHPEKKHLIMMPVHLVETPRWQQAFGADYHYTGNVNRALPIPGELAPLHDWVKAT